MSKHETWRTRQYWQTIGGLLVEEFVSVTATELNAKRPIDGLIVLNEPTAIHTNNFFDIKDKDVVIIQCKASRLGMYLLGQIYFSQFLIQKYHPRSIKLVAICGKTDSIMEEFAIEHNIEVVVISG
jgi:hypothetical protein